MKQLILMMFLLLSSLGANEAILEEVRVEKKGDIYTFFVRILHEDSGWEHYVNRYEVLNEKEEILATRVLVHPHEYEQPFTRSLRVKLPPLKTVYIRANDSVDGYSKQYEVPLP